MIRLVREAPNLHIVQLRTKWDIDPDYSQLNLSIWFSYETPVAYQKGNELVISKNIWSSTTGKHLNIIDPDKSKRIDNHEFNERMQKALNQG